MSRETEIKKALLDKLIAQMDGHSAKSMRPDDKFTDTKKLQEEGADHTDTELTMDEQRHRHSGELDPSPQDEDHMLDDLVSKSLGKKPNVGTPSAPGADDSDEDEMPKRGKGSIKAQMKRYLNKE